MGLGFLVPAFLAGLAALAVPILLHLRHKDRDRPQRFPSLMFLEQLTIRTESRQRISDWPLLLLRMLALALLVLAFSRPVFKDRSINAGDSRSKAVVILLDRSMSMDYSGVWARAVDSARAVIDGLEGKDRVALVAFDDAAEIIEKLTEDRQAVKGALPGLHTVRRGTRLAPALRTARQLLLEAPFAAAQVIVISDLQRIGTNGIAGVEFPSGVKVRGVGVGAPLWSNSSIRSVEARRVREGDRTMLAVKARVVSHGLPAARQVNATLTVNGRNASSASAALNRDGETAITFPTVPAPDGMVTVSVSLPADSLAADDTLFAVVPRDNPLRVALVVPGGTTNSETLYLQQALAIGRAPAIQVTRTNTVPSGSALAQTDVIMFWDETPDLGTTAEAWLENGGSIVVAAGRRLSTARQALPAYAGVRFSGSADRIRERGGSIREISSEHPLFAPFRETPEALHAARMWQYPRADLEPGSEVLASFDDGLPAVIERRSGRGKSLSVMIPLDNQQSDFALQPAFLPFLRQLMSYASGRDAAPLWHSTGESWLLPATLKDPVVESPTGALIRPSPDSAGAAVPLTDAGLYRAYALRAAGEPAATLAVNVAAAESDLTPMDTTELLLGVRTIATPDGTPEPLANGNQGASLTVEELEKRQSPWKYLLLAVLVFLVAETLLGTQGRRGTARRSIANARAHGSIETAPANGRMPDVRGGSGRKPDLFKESR